MGVPPIALPGDSAKFINTAFLGSGNLMPGNQIVDMYQLIINTALLRIPGIRFIDPGYIINSSYYYIAQIVSVLANKSFPFRLIS